MCVSACVHAWVCGCEYNKEMPVKFLFDMYIIVQVLLGMLFTYSYVVAIGVTA